MVCKITDRQAFFQLSLHQINIQILQCITDHICMCIIIKYQNLKISVFLFFSVQFIFQMTISLWITFNINFTSYQNLPSLPPHLQNMQCCVSSFHENVNSAYWCLQTKYESDSPVPEGKRYNILSSMYIQ